MKTDTVKAAKLLVKSLVLAAGGYSAVANSLGISRQYVYTYTRKGYFPVETSYKFATSLGLSPWSLCYVILYRILGEEAKDFEKVVKETPLLDAEKAAILKVYNKGR